ncbi:GyrI-like domain-containing protein [Polluticaenibacter yanchengensis]|uniref:GyrI-like domain-containing protein n=1 Tax=Polluticaenibacter yanchengensis TaxID=3014562 RepID=A0ABT4UPI0_9BACT|nr:GyrI-like domain-containing protein [Chitinophagaceae bacterium LY-5]
MTKIDLAKKDKAYYTAGITPEITEIGECSYLSLTGKGDPSDKAFAENIEALYSVAYKIKFAFKAIDKDFVVAKLEGLWWYDEERFPGKNYKTASSDVPRSEWEYRLLIRLPDFVTANDVAIAKEIVVQNKGLKKAATVGYYTMKEGKCVQILHIGPFANEPATLEILGTFIEKHRFAKNGLHHEIYLSDFRKTAPEKLKTILREPVK